MQKKGRSQWLFGVAMGTAFLIAFREAYGVKPAA